MSKKVRVRFAPSPTGPLHIGGVRTALYNFLYARKNHGDFILRIEDTDRTRFIPGAEEYIIESLKWLGLDPDESPWKEGEYGPYRQSDRLAIYKKHVHELVEKGMAYYAFDTPQELEEMRTRAKSEGIHSPKYDSRIRLSMKNSLTLSKEECEPLLQEGTHVTVRLKMPEEGMIHFDDVVRGSVEFQTVELDDKIILKADGYPTYHLANVVDDYHMKISHVIRGEEWLSSTAHHVFLYQAFGWERDMPKFVHLPLLLKPTGKGKLSKRDGVKFGFPVFPLEWKGGSPEEHFKGFREDGFLPEAVINFLALLGWNPGTDQELFSLSELVEEFSLQQIIKSGAQFNYDKAKWFNQNYLMSSEDSTILDLIRLEMAAKYGHDLPADKLLRIIGQLKPRVETLFEMIPASAIFFEDPTTYDEKNLSKRTAPDSVIHLQRISQKLKDLQKWEAKDIETSIKGDISENQLKFGAILPVLRIFIAGSMSGPDLFEMMEIIGKVDIIERLHQGIQHIKESNYA